MRPDRDRTGVRSFSSTTNQQRPGAQRYCRPSRRGPAVSSLLPRPRPAESIVDAPATELDLATVDALRATLAQARANGAAHVLLDLSRVTFMDATALGVIVEAANAMGRLGGSLRLTGASPLVEMVLHATRLHDVLMPA